MEYYIIIKIINIINLKKWKRFIKEYNFNSELIYEEEYLNGERKGKGKENHRSYEL